MEDIGIRILFPTFAEGVGFETWPETRRNKRRLETVVRPGSKLVTMSNFGVPASAHAYIDQFMTALIALFDSSRSGGPTEMVVEGLDDIEIRSNGALEELIQVKSHLAGSNLTDRSADLWKTIRVWCELYRSGQLDIGATNLVLLTTQKAAPGSACAALKRTERKVDEALAKLNAIAGEATATNAQGYAAFLKLSSAERRQLLTSVLVADGSSQGAALEEQLRARLEYSVFRGEQLEHALSEIVGWWIRRVASNLRNADDAIQASELRDTVRSIMNNLRREALPVSKEIQAYTRGFDTDDEAFLFIRQLRLVTDSENLVLIALHDYLRCEQQVSLWLRDSLLFADDGERYANDLRDSWRFLFEAMRAAHAEVDNIDLLRKAGLALFMEVMKQDRAIKPECRESFIMRGSYHRLANELLVGWHAHYQDLLACPRR